MTNLKMKYLETSPNIESQFKMLKFLQASYVIKVWWKISSVISEGKQLNQNNEKINYLSSQRSIILLYRIIPFVSGTL